MSVLTVALAFGGFLPLAARAAQISGFSDTLSTLTAGADADHSVLFVSPNGVNGPGDDITVTWGISGTFDLSGIVAGDVDLGTDSSVPLDDCVGPFTEKTLAASASSGVWGAAVSGQALTLAPPIDAGVGEIAAATCVRILVGTNASSQSAGLHQIINPGAGMYGVTISVGFGDTGMANYEIMTASGVLLTATVGEAGGGGGGGGGGPVAPHIVGARALNMTENAADVLWNTDVASTSFVDYGTTAAYGSTATVPGTTFNHVVNLSGLIPATAYHFRVRSTGINTPEGASGDFTFTTLDLTAPIISNIGVTDIGGTSASVTWDTDENTDSTVDYGTSPSYGGAVSNAIMTNAHRIDLSGLTPNTLYRFRVTSKDLSNNSSASIDLTFLTLDTISPVISNIFVDAITKTSGRVNWTTDELADSRVVYGTTDAYGATAGADPSVANHQVVLSPISSGAVYHFRVISRDAFGNASTSTDRTFTTVADTIPPANAIGLTVTPGDRQNALSWINPSDTDFAGVKVRRSTSGYPATPTQGTGIYGGAGTSVTDAGLTNGRTYYYAVFAYDASANYASGALGHGTPVATPSPTPPPPVPPPVVTPPQTTPPGESMDRSQIEYLAMSRTVRLAPNQAGAYEMLPGKSFSVLVPDTAFKRPVDSSVLNFGGSSYLFRHGQQGSGAVGGYWVTDVQTPAAPASVPSNIIVTYSDSTNDIASFTVSVKPLGLVYENSDTPVAGAAVTLYRKNVGAWQVWDAAPYFQSNPQVTTANGAYGFVVPVGTYRLEAKETNHRPKTTAEFSVKYGVVDWDIELIKIPGQATDLPGQVAYIAKIINQEIIQNPIVERVTLNVIVPVAALITAIIIFLLMQTRLLLGRRRRQEYGTVHIEPPQSARGVIIDTFLRKLQSVVAASSTVVSLIALILYRNPYILAFFIFQLALYLVFRRLARPPRPKNWGVVYDEATKKPVPFAVIRIIDAENGKVLESRVTDSKGRYGFLVDKNKYFVTVEKPAYETRKTREIDLSVERSGEGVMGLDIGIAPTKPQTPPTPPISP